MLGSIGKLLGGGTTGRQSTQSGFALLPKQIQDTFTGYAGNVNREAINNPGFAEMFRPLDVQDVERTAIEAGTRGFTPDQQTLNADIEMQMNPYNRFVIDEINRQAGGEYSILKQALAGAGQLGSNRSILGANDIDLSRQNQIGGFLQGQFDKALQNSLDTLTSSRRADAATQMGIGEFLRNLNLQSKQTPFRALQAQGSLLGALPQDGGSTGTERKDVSPGIGDVVGGAGSLIQAGTALASFFSDPRLKENIRKVGEENGFNLYEFSYIGHPQRFIGVMADEVQKVAPDAVTEVNGYLAVDYRAIGIEMREAA